MMYPILVLKAPSSNSGEVRKNKNARGTVTWTRHGMRSNREFFGNPEAWQACMTLLRENLKV